MASETIGQEYRPASFEPLNISARKSYSNLGQRKGAKDKFHSDLEPAQLGQILTGWPLIVKIRRGYSGRSLLPLRRI